MNTIHNEELLEQLFWEFDDQHKRSGEERLTFKSKLRFYANQVNSELLTDLANLKHDLEHAQLKVAACSVVAMADTAESAKVVRTMHPMYLGACVDVARRVDECILLRVEREELLRVLRAVQLNDLSGFIYSDPIKQLVDRTIEEFSLTQRGQ